MTTLRICTSVLALAACLAGTAAHAASCASLHVEGQVDAGKSYNHAIDATHQFMLEAIPSGWIVRVLPTAKAHEVRAAHDYAELATPPYRSPNPILISTDFAFRAQDAIAWNPREFHYFTTAVQLATATQAYEATMREPNRPAAGAALFSLLPTACTARLRILDARIVGGTANQSLMAAAVASHFAETAHTVETNAAPTPLGKIVSMRFLVTFEANNISTVRSRPTR